LRQDGQLTLPLEFLGIFSEVPQPLHRKSLAKMVTALAVTDASCIKGAVATGRESRRGAADAGWAADAGVPQSLQKRVFGSIVCPQEAQLRDSTGCATGVPQSLQKRVFSSKVFPQEAQLIQILHILLMIPPRDAEQRARYRATPSPLI